MKEKHLRQEIIDMCRHMNAIGLNQGTSGNISARHHDAMLITPSAIPYAEMKPDMIASMPLDRADGHYDGPLKPSVEWRFHLDIMKSRPDVGAIVHTHSTYATVLAIAGRDIPACHYMIAAFGGTDVRCAPYARYGTKELSINARSRAEGPQRLPARQPRHDRRRPGACQDDVAGRGAGDAGQTIFSLIADRRPGDPFGRGDCRRLKGFATYGLQDKRDG